MKGIIYDMLLWADEIASVISLKGSNKSRTVSKIAISSSVNSTLKVNLIGSS